MQPIVDPLTGQSGMYSPEYLKAAGDIKAGNSAPYSTQYLAGLGLTAQNLNGVMNPDEYNLRFSTTPSTSGVQTGGAGGSGVNTNFVNQAYDTKIAGLRSVYDTLQPQQDVANLNVNNQWQNQTNALQTQKAQGQRNLQIAGTQVEENKAKSLNDLRNQVQTMGMNYNHQLGAYGAGDSSAAQMIQQALSGMASKNRANVMDGSAQQLQQIDLQGQDLQVEFDNNMKSLEDWKSASLNDIATKFMQQKQAIQQQMIGADADRYQALASADANYTQQAIAQLANLEGIYKQQATDLVGQYQNIQSPQASINGNLLQYAVNPISAGQIAAVGAVPQLPQTTDPTPLAQRRPFQQDYSYNLGY